MKVGALRDTLALHPMSRITITIFEREGIPYNGTRECYKLKKYPVKGGGNLISFNC